MKTKPYPHQANAVAQGLAHEWFADFSEQGTGKTWTLLAECESWHHRGEISRLLVIAPRGVHDNWITRQIPAHLSTPIETLLWRTGPKGIARQLADMADPANNEWRRLKIVAVNYEALLNRKVLAAMTDFVMQAPCAVIADESHYLANDTSARTRAVMQLMRHAVKRRCASGTPITKNPSHLWAQFNCLQPGALPFRSREAMLRRYAEILPREHPLVRHIMDTTRARRPPLLVARDDAGEPQWKRLDELAAMIAPHSRRNRKSLLDLPEKLYEVIHYELPPELRAAYRSITNHVPLPDADADLLAPSAAARYMKHQQIASGFILDDFGEAIRIDPCARLAALRPIVDGRSGPIIIWAHFQEEQAILAEAMNDWGVSYVAYHGGTPDNERHRAIDEFQAGRVDAFLGNQAAGGTGIDLTAANTVIFFSNSFNSVHRQQAEDRAHRIGQKHAVMYYDLVAVNTINERLLRVLQSDEAMKRRVLRDDEA